MDILDKKYYKEYNSINRYSQYPFYYNKEDKKFMGGITGHLSNQTAFITHYIVEGDSLDSLALYYYGNPTKYWIIADYNRIQDPFDELKAGRTIKIPSYADIMFES